MLLNRPYNGGLVLYVPPVFGGLQMPILIPLLIVRVTTESEQFLHYTACRSLKFDWLSKDRSRRPRRYMDRVVGDTIVWLHTGVAGGDKVCVCTGNADHRKIGEMTNGLELFVIDEIYWSTPLERLVLKSKRFRGDNNELKQNFPNGEFGFERWLIDGNGSSQFHLAR